MRGLGAGQRVHVVCIDEVASLICSSSTEDHATMRDTSDAGKLLKLISPLDVLAWLVRNSDHTERVQSIALQQQKAALLWRVPAISALLISRILEPETRGDTSSSIKSPKLASSAPTWTRFLDHTSSADFLESSTPVTMELMNVRDLRRLLLKVTSSSTFESRCDIEGLDSRLSRFCDTEEDVDMVLATNSSDDIAIC